MESRRVVRVLLTGYVDTQVSGDPDVGGVLDAIKKSVEEGLSPEIVQALNLEFSRVDVLPEHPRPGILSDFKNRNQMVGEVGNNE